MDAHYQIISGTRSLNLLLKGSGHVSYHANFASLTDAYLKYSTGNIHLSISHTFVIVILIKPIETKGTKKLDQSDQE